MHGRWVTAGVLGNLGMVDAIFAFMVIIYDSGPIYKLSIKFFMVCSVSKKISYSFLIFNEVGEDAVSFLTQCVFERKCVSPS